MKGGTEMFEIRKNEKRINDVDVATFERDVEYKRATMEVEAGTTGFCGGEREEGGRAFIRISAKGADFYAKSGEKNGSVVIAVCGDEGIMALVESLAFALEALVDELED